MSAVAVVLLGASAAVAGATVGKHGMGVPACTGANLSGTFVVRPDSAGAGNISYKLLLKNRSATTCFVSGIPGLRLLDKTQKKLPTHVTPSHPGAGTAVKVTLAPGKYASLTTRFSPDVPGTGEPTSKQCEPTAYTLKVSPAGGGSLLAPIRPPTPVCEHGSLFTSVLVAGKTPPLT